jgi:aryl carrier-like protein
MLSTAELPAAYDDSLRKLRAYVLGCRTVDIKHNSNFFDLGGDSVTAVRLIAAAHSNGLDLPVQ